MDDRDNAEVWVLQEIEPPIEFADLSSGVDANHVEPHHHEYAINNKQSHPLIENSPEVGSIQTLQIRELIAPFLLVLRWGGLYFEFERKNLGLSKGTPKHREVINYGVRRKRHLYGKLFSQCGGQTFETFSFCLCSITLIISLIDESRLIYAFYAQLTNSPETPRLAVIVDNLETIKWAFQCLIVHFILMVMCYQNRFTVLFEAWENIRTRYPDSAAATRHYGFTGRFRRKQRIMVVVSFAVLALNCYSLFGPLFIPAEVYEDFKIYVMEPFRPDNALVKALIVVAMVFRSFDYVFSATLFLLISDAVVLQFTQFYNDLSAQISDEGILQNPARLEWHRLKHTRLCALVQRVDSIFSPYVLIGLVSGMFGILTQVFVIYDFSKENKMGGITVMSYVYWSLLNLVQVLVILWSGSKVNVAALLPLAKLYEIDQRTLTIEQTQHLTVFLQKLTGCQTGYTALGIFTIDMTTVLSLAGFYFTYQILLFQMQNDSSLGSQILNMSLPHDIANGLRVFLNLTHTRNFTVVTIP